MNDKKAICYKAKNRMKNKLRVQEKLDVNKISKK